VLVRIGRGLTAGIRSRNIGILPVRLADILSAVLEFSRLTVRWPHRLEVYVSKVALQSQTLRNQNTIEQVEEPLHEQREHSGGNCALQNRDVIV
jgi:hypothetical protein